MNIKKRLLAELLLLCSVIGVQASDDKTLIVEMLNGQKTAFMLTEKPELTFANHVLNISMNGDLTDFEISSVKQMYFIEELGVGISNSVHSDLKIIRSTNNSVVIEGCTQEMPVQIFSIDGIQHSECVKSVNGRMEITLISLPKGIYIINIANQQTFKIIKK